jgi:hypothetical protein
MIGLAEHSRGFGEGLGLGFFGPTPKTQGLR